MNTLGWREKRMNDVINVFAQSSIAINGSQKLYFDPFHIPEEFHDADVILITHSHWDHFSKDDILKVKKETTTFFVPQEQKKELLNLGVLEKQINVVRPNETYTFSNIFIKTIPAYNRHHPKEKGWVGYLVTLDHVNYYISGDTDANPELEQINADVIFLPVGGTYTMTAKEGANLANKIMPQKAIPTHYLTVVGSQNDAKEFCQHLKPNIESKIYYDQK